MIADPGKLMPMPIEAVTEFDPGVHGFRFRNRCSGLDILGEINDGVGDVASRFGGDDFWKG